MHWFGMRMALDHRAHARHYAAHLSPSELLLRSLHESHPAHLYLWLFVLHAHRPLHHVYGDALKLEELDK